MKFKIDPRIFFYGKKERLLLFFSQIKAIFLFNFEFEFERYLILFQISLYEYKYQEKRKEL